MKIRCVLFTTCGCIVPQHKEGYSFAGESVLLTYHVPPLYSPVNSETAEAIICVHPGHGKITRSDWLR